LWKKKCSNKNKKIKNCEKAQKKTGIKLKAHTCLPQKVGKKNHTEEVDKGKQQIGGKKSYGKLMKNIIMKCKSTVWEIFFAQ
jgi:hypothetical protein